MLFRFLTAALVLSLSVFTVACDDDNNATSTGGTMKSDGYALFSVDNGRQQRDDVAVTIHNPDPGATYVLLYSGSAPKNAGWFLFDPSTRSRCGGEAGPHCEVPGYGYLVDYLKVADGAETITLRDERCGCDEDNRNDDWTGHWAVMRVERTEHENAVTFDVVPHKISSFTEEADVTQLQ